jgi:hypothetical protein
MQKFRISWPCANRVAVSAACTKAARRHGASADEHVPQLGGAPRQVSVHAFSAYPYVKHAPQVRTARRRLGQLYREWLGFLGASWGSLFEVMNGDCLNLAG